MLTAEDHACKDCRLAVGTEEESKTVRKTPHPGPRCHQHNLAVKKRRRSRSRVKAVERDRGITEEMYKRLGDWQGWRCYSCAYADGTRKALAVHHDHATGEVLALLCGPCNQFQDRVLKGSRAAALRLADVCTGADKDLRNAPSRLAWAREQDENGSWQYVNLLPVRIPRQRRPPTEEEHELNYGSVSGP